MVVKTGVQPGAVVEGFDVIENGSTSLSVTAEVVVIDEFVFESAPEGLDVGIIVAIAFATHRRGKAVLSEHLAISGAGELATAIGVEDELCSWGTLLQSHTQSGDDQLSIEHLMHGPADHAPGKDIQDGNKIQPTLAGENAGRVGGPNLVGPLDYETSKTVRGNWAAMAAVGGGVSILGALPREETLYPHETGNAVASPRASQHSSQPGTAIGLTTPHKFFSNALAQSHGLELSESRAPTSLFPIVIAAA